MLQSLNIKNILLIDKVVFEPSESLNIITGETGSGKSVVIDCLVSVLGGKARNITAGENSDKGIVTAIFDVSENDKVQEILIESDLIEKGEQQIILRRNFSASGKSQCYINDNPTTLNLLKSISPLLLEIYGQHDFSDLLEGKNHINILDNFANAKNLKEGVRELFQDYYKNKKNYEELIEKEEKAKIEEDYLRHVLKELEVLDVQPNEENELVEKRTNLKNSQQITETISKSLSDLNSNSVSSTIFSVQRRLDVLATELTGELKENITQIVKSLESASIELEEAESQIGAIASSIGSDEGDIDKVEERLFAIREMARKYRKTPDELLHYTDEIRGKVELIDSFEDVLIEAKQQLEKSYNLYLQEAEKLSDKRIQASKEISRQVNAELPHLKMEGAEFVADVVSDRDSPAIDGIDKITFKARLNKGQGFSDISKTASGGELARLMLALKAVISGTDKSSKTLIFDEIDTGISGSTADAVAARLKKLSSSNQVICITHQPQTAGKADRHFLVQKFSDENKTKISLSQLDDEQSKEDIARMLSGKNITDEARAAALKLKAV